MAITLDARSIASCLAATVAAAAGCAGSGGISEDGGIDAAADADTDADGDTDADTDTGSDPAAPLFDDVASYETTIAANGDPATVHYPNPPDLATGGYAFPIAVLLQGAEVGRQYYVGFASRLASYGFVVVVPDHYILSVSGPGLWAEESEVTDVLDHMKAENANPASPVHGALDTGRLVVLGHSYGGAAGLYAVAGECQIPFCLGGFERPAEFSGAAFYGTNLAAPLVGTIPQTANDGIPVALLQGTLDSKADPADGLETWEKIQDPPKAFVSVLGANHYGLCDTDNPPGSQADASEPTLDQAVAVETSARWAALFLRAHVLGDAAAAAYVHDTGDALDPNVTVQGVW